MKKLIYVMLLLGVIVQSKAQSAKHRDSLYYLLDTAAVPVNERMWETHLESPSLKFYRIECPCLEYDEKPTFIYSTDAEKGQLVSKKQMQSLKKTSLIDLIAMAKQTVVFRERYDLFIIEPRGKQYIYHKVRMLKPLKPREATVDFIIVPRVDTLKGKRQN